MNCFTPVTLPVLSTLALNYCVCDHWFCSIPSQTLCNRSFVQAGTSSGYVDNEGGGRIFANKTKTIYNLLSDAGRKWKVYTGGWTVTSLVLLTQERVWNYGLQPDYFKLLHDFETDAKTPGGLPSYALIEPNYMDSLKWGAENDMHPESHAVEFFGVSNVEEGGKLAYRVYSAVRSSPDWDKTLLIIMFDEHGGCYDHVSPGTTVSPDGVVIPQSQAGGSGFTFDHLGVRISGNRNIPLHTSRNNRERCLRPHFSPKDRHELLRLGNQRSGSTYRTSDRSQQYPESGRSQARSPNNSTASEYGN